MADNQFIEIDAPHLCVMEGESDELRNDGMYGKALALYLQFQLEKRGYHVPEFFCEDWGWYVRVVKHEFRMGVCIWGYAREDDEVGMAIYKKHGGPPEDPSMEPAGVPLSLCVRVETTARWYWDWKRFRPIDRSKLVTKLHQHLIEVFQRDPEIAVTQCCDEFPLL